MKIRFLLIYVMLFGLFACEKDDEQQPILLPEITDFSPLSGPVGTEVTVNGKNFSNSSANAVIIFTQGSLSKPAKIKEISQSNAKVVVPAELTPGDYSIIVKTNGQSVTSSKTFAVTSTLHTITSISPSIAGRESIVKIHGTKFSTTPADNKVTLLKASQADVVAEVTAATETTLSIKLPATIPVGEYKMKVAIGDYSVDAPGLLTIQEDEPEAAVIASFSPEIGEAGSKIKLEGENFNSESASNIVKLKNTSGNSFTAKVISASPSYLEIELPVVIPSGLYTIVLETNGKTTESSTQFQVLVPAPTIATISSQSGYPASEITITGTNFGTDIAQNEVFVVKGSESPIALTILEASTTTIKASLPNNIPAGDYNIQVKVGENTVTSIEVFKVLEPVQPPTITSFAPESVLAGSSVTIEGTNFSATKAENVVTFISGTTSVAATVISASATSLQVTVPASIAAGNYIIKIAVGDYTIETIASLQITVAHTITDFTPKDAEEGGRVLITGTNFSPVASENIVKLYQDGFINYAKVIEATTTSLLIQIPSPVFMGSHYIEVTIDGVTVRSSQKYTVGEYTVPNIESVSSMTFMAGDEITITGTNFSYEPEVLYVIFVPEGTTVKRFGTIISSTTTEIVVESPSYLENGNYTIEVHKGSKKGAFASFITIID